MDDIALTALKESIAHWEENLADPENAHAGYSSCALCSEYDVGGGGDCKGCPVAEQHADLRNRSCRGTPWLIAYNAIHVNKRTSAYRNLAIGAELDHLKKLLPAGEA
jgi:hypothetical protein